jgi:hypothetical protein
MNTMKILQNSWSVLILTFMLSGNISAQVNLDQGLILHYPFNGDAQDAGPQGNHGIISPTGCYPSSDINGIPSSAMLFNGAVEQGMIQCPDTILNGLSEFSMSYWFNPLQLTNGMSLVGQDNIIETGFYTSSNRVVVWHPTSGSVNVPLTQGVNAWQHIAVTCSNTQMKIYHNGLLVNTLNGNYSLGTNTNIPGIGGNVVNQSNNSWFRGKIDEVRFYDRVLNQDEVNLLSSSFSLTYGIMSVSNSDVCTGSNVDVSFVVLGAGVHPDNMFYLQLSDADGSFDNPVILAEQTGTTSGTFSGVTVPEFMKTGNGYKLRIAGTLPLYQGTPSTQSLTIRNASEGLSTLKEGLILHYAFDGNTSDSSGLLKHGVAYGGTTFVDDRFGNPFSALQLNGTNGYVEVPPGVWFDESSFTIATWVKPTTYNNWSRILDFSNGPSSDNVVFALSNGTSGNLYCDIRKAGTSSGVVNGVPAPLNKWSHCVLTYNGIHLKIYLNGNLVGTGASTGARMVFRTQNFIGRSAWSTDAFANAAYDDFMLWNRTLTDSEIKVLANDGLIFSNSPVCEGNVLFIEAPEISGTTYQWAGPDSFSSISRINELSPATLSMSGNYSLTVTNGSCEYDQSQKQISIQTASAQSTPSFAGLPANTYTGAATNSLTPTPAGGFFNGPGISGSIFDPTSAGTGIHNIIYSYMNTAGCVSTVSNTVNVGNGYSMINGTITDCDGGFFDSGGGSANYQNNENYIMTFCSDNNERLQFNIKALSIGTGDTLWAYDGPDTNSELLAMYIAWSNRDYIWSSGTCLTFRFKSDASATTTGWEAEFFCMPDPTVPNEITDMSTGFRRVCNGIFRDPGGSGNYSVGTHRTQTFRSENGERLRLDFTMLNINGNNNGHWLRVYDGPTTAYPLIGSYNEWAWPPGSKVESTGEYLTFVFDATNTSAGSRPGWEATWSCTTPALPVVNIQNNDTTICAAVFCDNGGLSSNYSHNANDTITLSAISGKILELTFNHNNTQFGAGDTLWVYDGPDVNSNLKAMYITNSRMDNLYSSGTDLTFVFRSDGSGNGRGWQGYVNCVDAPAPVVTYDMSTGIRVVCGGVFRDPGGGGNYSVGTHRTQTFRSENGERLRLDFTMLNINGNNNGHWLRVYDGPTTAYPLIGSYNEWAWPPGSKVESTGEYLTFVFDATNTSAGSRPGWEATWSCTTPALPVVNIQNNDTTICAAVFCDNGGLSSNYSHNANDTITLSAISGKILELTFNHNNTQFGAGDTLWVYDGPDVNSNLKAMYITNSRMDNLYSSGTDLTFVFRSDGSGNGRGWQGYVNCVDAPAPVVTYDMSTGIRVVCGGVFRDPGGGGNYSVGTHRTQTFRSENGERLRLDFTMLNINGNNNGHWLRVYDGPTTAYPLIGSYNEWAWPPGSKVESTGEYLTFVFDATNTSAGSRPGWEAVWTCTTPALPHIYVGDSVSPICDAVIYDHAGPAMNYGTNRKDTTVVCSDNSQLLQVIFNHNETGLAAGDTLWIFDGNSVLSPPLGKYITSSRIDQIVSSGTCLTFVFSSDNANQNRGWQGVVSCITVPPGQITYIMSTGERFVCQGTFLDPGGSGNYPRGSWVQTYTAYNGERLRFTRNMFNVNGNNGGHPFSVYDGPTTASPLIGTYTNFAYPPAVFQSTGSSLTFAFNSNNTSAGTTAGWDFSISCFSGNPVDVMWVNSPVCAGDTIMIEYVLNDTVGVGNIFTAQLSDMNGNFASPVNIGTLASTTDGQIEVVIPHGTLPGSGYRIRIMSSAPVQIGNPSPNPITVFAPPSMPVVTPSGLVQICGGTQDVNLSIASQSGVNYKWYRDGTIEVGSNLPFYTAQTSGSYTIVVQNSCASVTSAPVIVDAVLLPAPPVIHAPLDTGICSGQSVLLITDSLSGVNWQWKVDGTNTGGNHFELLTAIPGIYHVEISNACGTVSSVNSVEVFITGQIPDPPVISASGSIDLCSGEQVELSVPFLSGHDYEWKKDGQTTGTNTHTLTVDQDGVYHVIVSNHCGSATSSNNIVVTLTYPPEVALILTGGPTEFCNGGNVQLSVNPQSGVSYHWFSNSIPVGTNQPFLEVDTSGSYTVSLMNVCGSIPSSDTIAVIVHSLPVVTYVQTPDLMCLDWGNVLLGGGLPAGGDYSGPGVSNGEINTVLAGIGTHIITYTYTDSNNCVVSDTSLVIIDACTDMPLSYGGFSGIFPNPAANEFYVTCHDFESISRIHIFGISGNFIAEVIIPAGSLEPVSIGFLPSGMYMIKFIFRDGSISRHKLLKQ